MKDPTKESAICIFLWHRMAKITKRWVLYEQDLRVKVAQNVAQQPGNADISLPGKTLLLVFLQPNPEIVNKNTLPITSNTQLNFKTENMELSRKPLV